ncbi:hypothetical protein VN12_13160 [Pirellula sp. SH-Sr6A]|nr:hypothetical protein VN12_13160 [Pirellula sp. SH-Sr6A]
MLETILRSDSRDLRAGGDGGRGARAEQRKGETIGRVRTEVDREEIIRKAIQCDGRRYDLALGLMQTDGTKPAILRYP